MIPKPKRESEIEDTEEDTAPWYSPMIENSEEEEEEEEDTEKKEPPKDKEISLPPEKPKGPEPEKDKKDLPYDID